MGERDARLDRRRLLRRAGLAATGGVAAAAAVATPAAANPGDNVILGQSNDSGTFPTGLEQNSGDVATLSLTNTTGATLQLVPTNDNNLPTSEAIGLLAVDSTGDLSVVADFGTTTPELFATVVYSSRWAAMTEPTKPTRVLDTRNPAQRVSIVAGANAIDSAGRVKAGSTIVVSLDAYVSLGSAVHANVTVAQTAGAGFITVWGTGPRPNASSLNFFGANQILSNSVLSPLGTFGMFQSVVAIFAQQTTAIIMDVTAFDVGGPWQVQAALLASPDRAAQTPGTRSLNRPPGSRALIV
jgi:hypothetical protein